MKKTVLTTAILCLFALCDVQAQIDNRYHWYDGTITYTATHLEHSNVKMYGMDEGEEHEFVLRYTKEVNPEHQLYSVIGDNLGFYNTGLTAHHQKAEGLDVICIYDSNDLLKTVMSGETEWEAEILNQNRWLNQIKGSYTTKDKNGDVKNIEFTMENMSVDHIIYPFEIICFNGRATGFIRVEEVPGALNELQGMWKIEPTLEGLHMYSQEDSAHHAQRDTRTSRLPLQVERPAGIFRQAVVVQARIEQLEGETLLRGAAERGTHKV